MRNRIERLGFNRPVALVVLFCIASLTSASFAAPSFEGIGTLDGGSSRVFGLSSSGDTVVGVSGSGEQERAARWSAASGLVLLGDLDAGPSRAFAASENGDFVVGRAFNGAINEAFRWSANDGMIGLGGLSAEGSEALGVSADGSVVVGFDGLVGRGCANDVATGESDCPSQVGTERAFVWRSGPNAQLQQLPTLPNDPFARAQGVSADGTTVVGISFQYVQSTVSRGGSFTSELVDPIGSATYWDLSNSVSTILSAPANALGITANDEVFVSTPSAKFIGPVDGPLRPLGGGLSIKAVAADGVTLLGQDFSFKTAVANRGALVHLKPLLMQHFGLNLTGWVLGEATAISADGLTFAGNGTNPLGQKEGWVAQIDAWPDAATLAEVPRMTAFDFATPLVSAVLPTSRSARVGEVVTAFVTIINTEVQFDGIDCRPGLASDIPAIFDYHQTDAATNATIGEQNVAANIPSNGGQQTFVIGITPTAPFNPADIQLSFDCANSIPARSLVGVNTLSLSASTDPVPDVVALATTADQIIFVGEDAEFAVAIANVGSSGQITASLDTAGVQLPLNALICRTDGATGACIESLSASSVFALDAATTASFKVVVGATGAIPFDPANRRLFVRFRDSSGTVRGATSLAVRAQGTTVN